MSQLSGTVSCITDGSDVQTSMQLAVVACSDIDHVGNVKGLSGTISFPNDFKVACVDNDECSIVVHSFGPCLHVA